MRCWMLRPTRPTWKSEGAERFIKRALLTLLCAGVASGCALFRDGPGYDAIDLVDANYTEDEQRQIGMDFDRALREEIRFIDDPVVSQFIEDLGQSIVAETGTQPFVYRFRVIDAPSLNAFAVFGGYVYIHSGTLLAVTSIDELAGVIGHEVAHVRMEHHARIQEKTKIPDLLAEIAGLAGAGVTGNTDIYTGTMGVNVALQLHFTRKLEAEADHHGTLYMAEAGYDPAGVVRFFERIVAAKRGMGDTLPPYLYSHPEVEDRIGYVEAQALQLDVAQGNAARLAERMQDAQARLTRILDADRASLLDTPEVAGNIIGPLMRAFERMRSENRPKRALEMLRRAELLEPNDPRVYFQRGELLASLGRHEEAVPAFEKTIELDPARALPYFRLAESLEVLGERERAVRGYEAAEFRAGANGQLRKRASWAVVRLTFDEWEHCRKHAPSESLPANQLEGVATDVAQTAPQARPCPGDDS